jgi:hypothetical protein
MLLRSCTRRISCIAQHRLAPALHIARIAPVNSRGRNQAMTEKARLAHCLYLLPAQRADERAIHP